MKIKIAVIGSGQMSNNVHLPILAKLRDEGLIELTLIADINADAALEFLFSVFGNNRYPYHTLLNANSSDVDKYLLA